MKKISLFSNFNLPEKTVLLRTNYDVPLRAKRTQKREKMEVADETRIVASLTTIKHLLKNKCKVIILSHLDRPGGTRIAKLSLTPVFTSLKKLLPQKKIKFSPEILGKRTKKMISQLRPREILVLENLRFDPREEKNDLHFAQKLASLGDFYVNEVFADCHRTHASIVGIAKFLPAAAGFELAKEVQVLERVYKKPKRPLVLILGGKKQDKLNFIHPLSLWADFILVGGFLPRISKKEGFFKGKVYWARLTKTGKDITLESAKRFTHLIERAKTIVWNGPMGVFEEKKNIKGTQTLALAIVNSKAFTLVGGGDTEAALTKLGLEKKFDFVSSGGGALLEFLSFGDLPGLKILRR